MTLRSVESGSLVVGQASTASAAGCWNLESSLALGVYADASVAPITQTISARTFIWRDRRAKRERDVSEQFRVGVYQRTMLRVTMIRVMIREKNRKYFKPGNERARIHGARKRMV